MTSLDRFMHKPSQTLFLLILTSTISSLAWADTYIGYTGKPWSNDFGVVSGQCDVQKISQLNDSTQTALLTINPNLGQLLEDSLSGPKGNTQQVDSQCFGHALELVPAGQRIHWRNPVNGVTVHLLLGNDDSQCRSFSGVTISQVDKKRFRGKACTTSQGQWVVKAVKPE